MNDFGINDIDREAEREGAALSRSKTYMPKQLVVKKLTTGKPQKEEPLDLLQILNVVH